MPRLVCRHIRYSVNNFPPEGRTFLRNGAYFHWCILKSPWCMSKSPWCLMYVEKSFSTIIHQKHELNKTWKNELRKKHFSTYIRYKNCTFFGKDFWVYIKEFSAYIKRTFRHTSRSWTMGLIAFYIWYVQKLIIRIDIVNNRLANVSSTLNILRFCDYVCDVERFSETFSDKDVQRSFIFLQIKF